MEGYGRVVVGVLVFLSLYCGFGVEYDVKLVYKFRSRNIGFILCLKCILGRERWFSG